jgi:Flp pilus assembly protein TadD
VELHPADHYAHFGLARALDRLGDVAGAAKHYKLARHLGSTLE